jgi:hypothetical protein
MLALSVVVWGRSLGPAGRFEVSCKKKQQKRKEKNNFRVQF